MQSHARPWVFLGIGCVLAALLAVVLFGVVGTGAGSSGSTGGSPATVASYDEAPGINSATGTLLDLTDLPKRSQKSAPNFALTDQAGHRVSLAQFKGKVVIVSGNDDQCTDVCTLLANDIVVANKDLGPAAKDVVWLSVNANPFYPSVNAVKTWTDEHGLGGQPNWYFATGSPPALRRVWNKYGITVALDRKDRSVEHSTDIDYVDPAGKQRAVAGFGQAGAASTAQFAHGLAQMADDLLPASARVRVAGPDVPAATKTNASINAVLPGFTLPNLRGSGRYSLAAHRGRYVVIDFWSSTCTVCKTELPAIEAAYKANKKSVDFVGVDETDPDLGAAKAMARKAGLTFPLVSDEDGTASGSAQITGMPYTVIISPRGVIDVQHPGTFTTEQLTYVVQMLLDTPANTMG